MTYLADLVDTRLDVDFYNGILGALPSFVRKRAATGRTNSTLLPDPALRLPVRPSAVYLVTAMLVYTASAAGDFKFGWGCPTGATMNNWTARWRDLTPQEVSGAFASASTYSTSSSASAGQAQAVMRAVLVCSAAMAGNAVVGVTWAQATTDVTQTSVDRGSWMRTVRVR